MDPGNDDNDTETTLDTTDIMVLTELQGEDYETLMDATESRVIRTSISNTEQMRHQCQMLARLENELKECQDVEMCDPEEVNQMVANFDPASFGQHLLSLTDTKDVLTELRQCWSYMVPYVYSWPILATGKIDRSQRSGTEKLLLPIKMLLCGNVDHTTGWANISTPKKRTICGKMFKTDGIVYQCWTCSSDPTTVLCSECFMNSEHRHHKYRMASSSGGGFCDCGDVESWRAFPHCSLHAPEESSPGEDIPVEQTGRLCSILEMLFTHCIEVLCWTDYTQMPPYFQDKDDSGTKSFATVIFNDEIHLYTEVTTCLSKTLGVSRNEAYDLATSIDKDGRVAVCVGNLSRCKNMKEYIDVTVSLKGLPPIASEVIGTKLLAQQEFALDVLQWIEQWIGESEAVRDAVCCATTISRDNQKSLLERILLQDDVLWKATRAIFHKILINSFIEPEWKIVFSDAYIKNYPDIVSKFLTGHDESLSFAELSVQLLTTPSLSVHLLVNQDGLNIIASSFLSHLQTYATELNTVNFDGMTITKVYQLRKTLRILADIRYLLSAIPKDIDIEVIGNGLMSGIQPVTQILALMQGMNSYRRETLAHVRTEPEWETAFNLTMRLITSTRLLIEFTGRNEALCKSFAKQIVHVMKSEGPAVHISYNYELVRCFDHDVNCIKYDVLNDPVSVHYPLSRLLTGALISLLQYISAESVLSECFDLPPAWLFEHSLRVRVLMAQSSAGLWKRNGLSVADQLNLISNSRCRAEMADRDLMALQIGAAIMDPNEFLIHVMNRFRTFVWMSDENLMERHDDMDGYTYKHLASMTEEFLELILQILLERYHPFIGLSDWQTMLQREMIHSLCCRNHAHNELFKDIDDPDDRKNFDDFTQTFDEILNEIAVVRKTGNAKTQYILKEDYAAMFNPYFFHYTRLERTHAEQLQLDNRKNRKLPAFIPIPLPPQFRPVLKNIVRLLDCDVMLKTLQLILRRAIQWHSHPFWNEGILRKGCHVIMLLLLEEKRGIVESLPEPKVRFISHDNQEIVKDISEMIYKLLMCDSQAIDPLKSLLSTLIEQIHELTKLVELSTSGKTISIQPNEDIIASLSFQQQKQLLEAKRRKLLAEARKAKILSKMNKMKTNFIKANKELYDQTVVQKDLSNIRESESQPSTTEVAKPSVECVSVFSADNCTGVYTPRQETCILCQESSDVKQMSEFMGLLCYRQVTKFLSPKSATGSADEIGIHLNTCGHTMHIKCFQQLHDPSGRSNWSNLLMLNYGRRSYLCLDPVDAETLCPFCHALCNILIPFWPEATHNLASCSQSSCTFDQFADHLVDCTNCVSRVGDDEHHRYDEEKRTPECLELTFSNQPYCNDTSFVVMIDELDRSQSRAQMELDLEQVHHCYQIRSFMYTVRSNFAWMEAEKQNPYSQLPAQVMDLLCQLSTLVVLHPEPMLSSWNISKRRSYYAQQLVEMKTSRTELDLTEAVIANSGILSRCRQGVFCRQTFRKVEQRYLLEFGLCRHLNNLIETFKTNMPSVDQWEVMNPEELTELQRVLSANFDLKVDNPCAIASALMQRSMEFLRICAFYYASILQTPFSKRLKDVNINTVEEYYALCEYLDIPHCLADQITRVRMKKPCVTLSADEYLLRRGRYNLIDLPYEYLPLLSLAAKPGVSDLVLSKSQFDDDTEESRLTFLCLHCGQVLTSSVKLQQMRSGQRGCAVRHMLECSGFSGIFIKIKDCMIVMLQAIRGSDPLKVRGAMMSAPYVDQYGDADDGLKRGYPLYLNDEMFHNIKQIWMRQMIPREASRYAHTHRIAFSLFWENF